MTTGQEARAMTDEKLGAEVKGLRAQLFSFRSQTVTEKVEDNSQFRKIRRDIARVMMVQAERAAAAKGPGKTAAPAKAPAVGAPTKAPGKPAKRTAARGAAKG